MIVVDTGVLFGAVDRDDPRHTDCARLLEVHAGRLAVPVPVVVEAAWMIESRVGPSTEADFLRSVNAGELTRIDLNDADWERVAELVTTYADLGLGTVDASVVATAERLAATAVATPRHRVKGLIGRHRQLIRHNARLKCKHGDDPPPRPTADLFPSRWAGALETT